MSKSWEEVQAAFPVNRELVWLNNCGTTPAGSHVVREMGKYLEDTALRGPGAGEHSPPALQRRIKATLSRLLNCHPDEIGLVHNTAEGMTMVALGLDLAPGDEVLVLEDEYPSNVYPWQQLAAKGVTTVFLPLAPTPGEFLEGFRARLGRNTRVVATSSVHWCTGMPLPIAEMASACHERDILFVVDGSQGVGQVSFDVQALGPCILCFSAWKWLLGPLGLGVLVVSRELHGKVRSVFKGPDGVARPGAYLPYQTEFKPNADRFTYSTASNADWAYFAASLDFLEALGFERVRTRIHELTDRLWQGLQAAGFRSAYDRAPASASGILAVYRAGTDAGRLVTELNARAIVARERLGRVRLAPHVYIAPEQLDRTVAAMVEAAK